MERCRICLEHKKNLCSVFETGDEGISYAEMITSFTKVKLLEEACKNNICLQCRRKLRNSYDFKRQIERSEYALNQHKKIFKFDNIDDVKLELAEDFRKEKVTSTDTDTIVKYISLFQCGCDSIFYKNIKIQKADLLNNSTEQSKYMPVLDLLNNIKHESEDDFMHEDIFDIGNSEDEVLIKKLVPRKAQRKALKEKGVRKRNKQSSTKLKRVCIKPVVLDNIKVIPMRSKETKTREKTRKKRLDMCPYCGKMSSNIKSHIMVHIGEKKYKCAECNKSFFTCKQLNYHGRNHLNIEAFKCDHCVAVFNNKTSLQSHMITHTDVKNHICPICNKGFKRKGALLRHKLIHNSSAKSLKCDLCNMSFLYKQGLRHHMRVHTGERPYNCEICSQPYSYKHDFNRHCLKKHGIFLKRRSIHVMNEEILSQERALMKDLMLRVQGIVKEGEPLNPFQGPQAALAFEQAMKALQSCQIPTDVVL